MEHPQQTTGRRKDSARLVWGTKPRRAPNPKDIEFQTAELVIPNPARDQRTINSFATAVSQIEINKTSTNRLIWGDNLLTMQALLASGYEGKIDLIYIDPPFWTGENYYASFKIEDTEITKSPSVIERLAYKDIWESGIDSYLDMMYPRLQLMKRLLADHGSLYIHADFHVVHYLKSVLDEIFGRENFQREIIWWPNNVSGYKGMAHNWIRDHETILFYSKTDRIVFNKTYKPYGQDYIQSTFVHTDTDGRRYRWRYKRKQYFEESKGVPIGDVWDIQFLRQNALERNGYPTQKPEALLERIIKTSSNEGHLVADFFCGSGTTISVAEKLNRRWIGCDFSKVAIQITRSRLVQNDAKPFVVENLGNYQRQLIYLHGKRINEMQAIVLKLYGASQRKDYPELGVRKEDGVDELVYVSYPDRPVTARKAVELEELAERLDGRGYKRLVLLGWDYEYNFDQILQDRKRSAKRTWRTDIVAKTIPPEVYEYLKKVKTADEIESLRKKIHFHEKPYLKLIKPKIEKNKKTWEVSIGIDRYVVFDLPIEDQKQKEEVLAIIKQNPLALIDYWAVDWDYDGVTFRSEWQAMRQTGRKITTVPSMTSKTFEHVKEYNVAVRVVDIFGNDATATMKVNLK